ncbi:uncharacterized protein LOC119729933 [Patiria miniata]|uniref:Fork-head domain-containing protein n=1 Tax=Patiria miniata TaxID=46514 RepID=A0A914A5G2_PATMI|nr:uncharacterized protein LOC119729933 [Patiria miniata]
MAAANTGGAGDNMLSLQSENAKEEPTVKTGGADGAESDLVPVKLESAVASASACTMAGDGNEKCPNKSVTPILKEGILQLLCTDGVQEDKAVTQTSNDNATSTPTEAQLATVIQSAEEVLSRESLAAIPHGSPTASEPGTAVMHPVPQVSMETMPEAKSAVKVQEEYAAHPEPVIKAAAEVPNENQNFQDAMLHTPPPQEHLSDSSPCQVAEASECLSTVTSLPASSPPSVQPPMSNASNSVMPDLGVFANSITDPSQSYCQVGNLQPSISSFNGFSQQQTVTDSLPGISTLTSSSNMVNGMTATLNNLASSSFPSGNMMNNVVYAAVPLQQTASGMQLAQMHPNANAYNLARPSGTSRRVLLPRGRSSSNTPKENSFKKTITPLTYEKPNVGLVQQIMEVFRVTGRKEMQPCEVYDGLECCYPYYLRMNPNRKKSWMSSVRHALTTPCFKSRRAENSDGKLAPRKGGFWSINDSYDPNSKPPKRVTPTKRPLGSPTYQRRQPLGVNTQQANWQTFPGHNHLAQQHHSARHSPYNYFSPTRGSFSPNVPVVYSPTRVYQPQTPTAALLPNGKMIYISPAEDDSAGHSNQSFGRDVYQAWGADSNTNNTPSMWQIVQNMGNDTCKDQADQNKIFSSTANGVQQQAVANMNCNNTAVTTTLGLINQQQQQQQQQDQLKLQLLQQAQLQQQMQQQQLQQQQQQQQQVFQPQQQSAADSDPFAVALELSEIKAKQESTDNPPQLIKPQQPASSNNLEQAMSVEMTCSPEQPQSILGETSKSTQQLTAKGDSSGSQQQGCEDLRSMVYRSLGVCNDLNTRPAVSDVAPPTQLTATPVTQFSALPTQYQLIHYSGNDTQYEGMVI